MERVEVTDELARVIEDLAFKHSGKELALALQLNAFKQSNLCRNDGMSASAEIWDSEAVAFMFAFNELIS